MADPETRPRHRLIDIPNIVDERGQLLFAQTDAQVPFPIRRLFVLHHVADGAVRGAHAHRMQHQLLIMPTGSCMVTVDNGVSSIPVPLQSPGTALYAPPMLWLDLTEFSSDAVCAVLASGDYDERDYIRDRKEFERLAGG